ncbi:triacylglycerol lipase [Fodinicola feengrottensis]|uniref:Triacylglycerol lipase n=1 Tax=Fodinicola feengrottensis TaxID=435914 RepID=A0ABN2G4Z9_9ACTN
MRALIRALATLFAVLTATAMAVPVAAAQAHLPVIFVHGFAHVSGQQHVFDNMVTQFESGGWTAQQLDVWTYDWKQSNVTTAQQLATEVDRLKKATGAAKVDIVAHSMGSLSSRYYLKSLGGTANVAHWVSLGGPNHGVSGAVLCGFYDSCDDMKPNSPMLQVLNSGNPTPGPTKYETLRSPYHCDLLVPDDSVILTGATNLSIDADCTGHLNLPKNYTFIDTAADFLNS